MSQINLVLESELELIEKCLANRPQYGTIEIVIQEGKINGLSVREMLDRNMLRAIYQ